VEFEEDGEEAKEAEEAEEEELEEGDEAGEGEGMGASFFFFGERTTRSRVLFAVVGVGTA
jgi:hypothetical protein